VFIGFYGRADVYEPMMWLLAAATMTLGNLVALRQTNVVRMLAYSGIAHAGYLLAPFAVAGTSADVGSKALNAIVTYLGIYVVMNLGAFAVVIAVARKTRSAELDSFGGLFQYAPGLAVPMTFFLISLTGIPPLGGWFAKFIIWNSLVSGNTIKGYSLAILIAVNSVIAAFYYFRILRIMWMEPAPDGDVTPIRVPISLSIALVLTVAVTLIYGFVPGVIGHLTDPIHLLVLGP
jgi:NADH-quinone oxidoreductase subunit N